MVTLTLNVTPTAKHAKDLPLGHVGVSSSGSVMLAVADGRVVQLSNPSQPVFVAASQVELYEDTGALELVLER